MTSYWYWTVSSKPIVKSLMEKRQLIFSAQCECIGNFPVRSSFFFHDLDRATLVQVWVKPYLAQSLLKAILLSMFLKQAHHNLTVTSNVPTTDVFSAKLLFVDLFSLTRFSHWGLLWFSIMIILLGVIFGIIFMKTCNDEPVALEQSSRSGSSSCSSKVSEICKHSPESHKSPPLISTLVWLAPDTPSHQMPSGGAVLSSSHFSSGIPTPSCKSRMLDWWDVDLVRWVERHQKSQFVVLEQSVAFGDGILLHSWIQTKTKIFLRDELSYLLSTGYVVRFRAKSRIHS